jgi:hypothetical protein
MTGFFLRLFHPRGGKSRPVHAQVLPFGKPQRIIGEERTCPDAAVFQEKRDALQILYRGGETRNLRSARSIGESSPPDKISKFIPPGDKGSAFAI